MSSRRNRSRNRKTRESGATSNPSTVQQSPSQPHPPLPEPQAKASRWKWTLDHHQAVASYLAIAVAVAGLYFQWSQQKDTDQQIEILRKSIQQVHAHEIAPRLVVDTNEEDELILAGEGIAVQLRNVGKGVANNAIVRVHFLRFEGESLEPERVVSRKTIAPGDSVPIRFKFPAPPETAGSDIAVIGTIGLYCQDDDDHEIIATQPFSLEFHQDKHGWFIVPHLRTPNIHRVNVNPRTSENVRTEHDAGRIIDHFVMQQHDRLRKFKQTYAEARSNED
ncbi:hypothetical protein GC163_09035 [bacterium]|nr:hypothetical protein [bacterium]